VKSTPFLPILCAIRSSHASKMATSPFDLTAYYRLSNDATGAGLTLSLGLRSLPPPTLQMTPWGAYSSENWQLFFDSSIYFIRNYDYGADWQLGVTG
jgi:hypothetical protein